MNYKLLNLLIFVTAWGWMTPAQAAAGMSVQQQKETHLVCHKQAQHWICDLDKSKSSQESAEDGAVEEAQSTADSQPASATPQVLSSDQQKSIANTLIWLSYLFPCGLALGLFLHHRYRVYRTVILQKQIENLERLWQHASDNDATSDTEQGTGGQ